MASKTPHILRFAVPDSDSSVLVQAVQNGDDPLDVKLVGTEGAAAYATLVNHNHVHGFKSKKADVSDIEWISILRSILTQDPIKDIEVITQVASETSINLIVRRTAQGFSTRLGTISLPYTEDEELELMEWCSTASLATSHTKQSLKAKESQITELEKTITELKNQLTTLVEARNTDEEILLGKFRDLLNEKKLKIRQQQLIIAVSGNAIKAVQEEVVMTEKTPEDVSMETPDEEPKPRVTRATRGRGRGLGRGRGRGRGQGRGTGAVQESRARKRKAEVDDKEETESEEEEEEGFEKMDVDRKAGTKEPEKLKTESDIGEEDRTTGDEETADEDEDEATGSDKDEDVKLPLRRSTRASRTVQKVPEVGETDSDGGDATASDDNDEEGGEGGGEKKVDAPPPVRALPFVTKKKNTVSEPPKTTVTGDAETTDEDEDDDEL